MRIATKMAVGMTATAVATLSAMIPATTASAGGQTPKTTGSIGLASPTQFTSWDAFQSNPVKGSISYTNFAAPEDGSGVWSPDSFSMGFGVGADAPSDATYAMTVVTSTPTALSSVNFSGTGDCGCGWLSTFTGSISGSSFQLSMTEINANDPNETYPLTAVGTIGSTGAVTGTWSDTFGGGRTGTFAIADIGHEVFHYVVPVAHASVVGHDAYFDYTVPANSVYSGPVYIHVYDGGSPGAAYDTWGFGTTPGNFQDYPIVSGNLSVFSYA